MPIKTVIYNCFALFKQKNMKTQNQRKKNKGLLTNNDLKLVRECSDELDNFKY